MPKAEPDVGAGLPAGPDAQPEREPPRQQLPETQRPAERALKPVISERKPKSVPLFRFARQDDAERFDPAIPTDTDELIDSLYFPDARSALDEARPDTANQPITQRNAIACRDLVRPWFTFGDARLLARLPTLNIIGSKGSAAPFCAE